MKYSCLYLDQAVSLHFLIDLSVMLSGASSGNMLDSNMSEIGRINIYTLSSTYLSGMLFSTVSTSNKTTSNSLHVGIVLPTVL